MFPHLNVDILVICGAMKAIETFLVHSALPQDSTFSTIKPFTPTQQHPSCTHSTTPLTYPLNNTPHTPTQQHPSCTHSTTPLMYPLNNTPHAPPQQHPSCTHSTTPLMYPLNNTPHVPTQQHFSCTHSIALLMHPLNSTPHTPTQQHPSCTHSTIPLMQRSMKAISSTRCSVPCFITILLHLFLHPPFLLFLHPPFLLFSILLSFFSPSSFPSFSLSSFPSFLHPPFLLFLHPPFLLFLHPSFLIFSILLLILHFLCHFSFSFFFFFSFLLYHPSFSPPFPTSSLPLLPLKPTYLLQPQSLFLTNPLSHKQLSSTSCPFHYFPPPSKPFSPTVPPKDSHLFVSYASMARKHHMMMRQLLKKHRKTRTAFSNEQLQQLERRFKLQKYLTSADRDDIAAALKLSNSQVRLCVQAAIELSLSCS